MNPTQPTSSDMQPPAVSQRQAPSAGKKKMFVAFAAVVAVAAIAVSAGLAWSGRNQVHAGELVEVTISRAGFGPSTIHIQKGQSVTWVNGDTATHEVVADTKTANNDPDAFDSRPLGLNDSYTVTFDKAGTYTYYDAANPYTNKGQVTVE